MLKLFTVLKSELSDKRIYVLDVNRYAMSLFSELALRGIRVSGFVTRNPEFAGETLIGLPVVTFADLAGRDDALVVVRDRVTPEAKADAGDVPIATLAEITEPDPELRGKNVRIYGTGQMGWNTLKELDGDFAHVTGFVQTKPDGHTKVAGLPIEVFDEVAWTEDDIVIVGVQATYVLDEVVAHIAQTDFPGTAYLKDFVMTLEAWSIDWPPLLNLALTAGRRIVACCDTATSRELFERVMRTCGVQVDRIVSFEDFWELADEDPEHCLLFAESLSCPRRCEMVEAAYDMGFSLADRNIASLRKVTHNIDMESRRLPYEHDLRLGASIDFTHVGGLPGWAVHGDAACEGARIMVLGGSTSSEVYVGESWPSMLHRMLESEGIENVVFNGAHESNPAIKELLRMERDICWLKPTVVVSMSGVNDRMPARDKFDAARGENPVASWKRTERHMKAIAESEGARFFAFYQPINSTKPKGDLFENTWFMMSVLGGAWHNDELSDDDFYTNIIDLFWDTPEAYIDICHYSEAGNAQIARVVFDTIKESL